MSVPLLDLHVKFLVDHTLRTVNSDPDKHLREIFGDARIEPHAALYGDRLIQEVKDWITTTKIPVVLGFELDPTQIPAVTIHLERNAPSQQYMGDFGQTYTMPIQSYERDVVVKKFSPLNVELSSDGSYITITVPEDMPPEQSELILPGLRIRDKNGKEYGIGVDKYKPTAMQISSTSPLNMADLSEMEVISPYSDAQYRQGVMLYDETALITVHGHSNRSEGLWLWAIVQWGLLKFRPLLIETFSLDLAVPMASDFIKDDQFLGDNVWRRFITLSAKAVWSWEAARQKDLLAFLITIKATASQFFQENSGPNPGSSTPVTPPEETTLC